MFHFSDAFIIALTFLLLLLTVEGGNGGIDQTQCEWIENPNLIVIYKFASPFNLLHFNVLISINSISVHSCKE